MTPLQLARAECANCEPDGGCLGMDIAPDGRSRPLWLKKPPRCVLADGQPCPYFETAILAGIPMIGNRRKADSWQEAADQYEERKKEHERKQHRLNEGSMVRTGPHGTAGYQEKSGAAIADRSRYANAPFASWGLHRADRRIAQLDQIATNRRAILQRQR